MTVKLNTSLRQAILKRVLNYRFQGPEEELLKQKHALAQEEYQNLFSPHVAALKSLPEQWRTTGSELRVSMGGALTDLPLGESKLVFRGYSNVVLHVYDVKSKVFQRWTKIQEQERTLRDQRRQAKVEVEAILNQATTLGKLITVWPEVEPLVKDMDAAKAVSYGVPTVVMADLNKSLGLPVKATKGAK